MRRAVPSEKHFQINPHITSSCYLLFGAAVCAALFAQVAYGIDSGRHKKTSVSVNGPTYMGSNIFARILSNSVYTLFGFVAVMTGAEDLRFPFLDSSA